MLEYEKIATKKELAKARRAREIQGYLEWPSSQELERIIKEHHIENVGISPEDVKRADKI